MVRKIWVSLCLAFGVTVAAEGMTMDEVINAFDHDINRPDFGDRIPRYLPVIEKVSGLMVEPVPEYREIPRAEVRATFYSLYHEPLRAAGIAPDDYYRATRFFYNRLKVVPEGFNLRENVRTALYAGAYGLYLPASDRIVMMEDVNLYHGYKTLLHELVHVAQDRVVDLDALGKERLTQTDTALAYRAVVEGQAGLVETLVDMADKLNMDRVDQELYAFVKQVRDNVRPLSDDIHFETIQFPYYQGWLFAAEQYLKGGKPVFKGLLHKLPRSTEQILHPEKYLRGEEPQPTPTDEQRGRFTFCDRKGEFFINRMFRLNLGDDDKNGLKSDRAAAGWGGDTACITVNGKENYFVWDTVWDTAQDAKEFENLYATAAERRLGGHPGSDILIKREGKRVFIAEGLPTDAAQAFY